jgi:hypothetical protein
MNTNRKYAKLGPITSLVVNRNPTGTIRLTCKGMAVVS